MTTQIIFSPDLTHVLMTRDGHFASLGHHYGAHSTALTLHQGNKTHTYHIFAIDAMSSVPLCEWVDVAGLLRNGYFGTCSGTYRDEGTTWSSVAVDVLSLWVLDAAVRLLRLGRFVMVDGGSGVGSKATDEVKTNEG